MTHNELLSTLALTEAEWLTLSSAQQERLAKLAIKEQRRKARKNAKPIASYMLAASDAQAELRYNEAAKIVATNKCPQCGNTLYRNLALTGWWQCNGYPSPGFRKPGHENDAPCSFQIFTRS